MILPGFVGPSYVSVSPNIATEVLQNWMPQTVEVPSEPARVAFIPTPGLRFYLTLGDTPVRQLFAQDGRTFAVGGQTFYETTGGVVVSLGTLSAKDANPAHIVSSGTAGHQLYITSGGKGDIFDLVTNTVTPITAVGYPSDTAMGTYLDTYFLTTKGNSAQFNISGVGNNGLSWASLDFQVRIAASDNLMGIIQNNKLIWLIGSETSEVQYNAAVASFPFVSVPQVLIPSGTCAAHSIVRCSPGGAGSVCWLQQSERGRGSYVIASGYQPERISTYALEETWSTYPTLLDCASYVYTDHGHECLVATFPSGNATWVFDFTESKTQGMPIWHQRSWWNLSTANADRHRGWVHCFDGVKHLVGDWQNGHIFIVDTNLGTELENPIRRVRRSPHATNEQKVNFYSNFQLDMETGLGNTTAAGTLDPVLLQWSDDGGHTFNGGVDLDAGAVGEYLTRCRVPGNLGSSRNRVFQIVDSSRFPRRILQAYVTVSPGTN